jgi:DNA-directed RNA polymerase subunit RPC12/RpoP
MKDGDAIIVTGVAQPAEVISTEHTYHRCPHCENVITVSAGMISDGDSLKIVAGKSSVACPSCGKRISLT